MDRGALQVAETLSEEGNGSEADCQDEILKLQESEAEERAEIQNVKSEVSDAYKTILHTEEQITEIKQELLRECKIQPNIKSGDVHALLAKKTEIQKLQMKAEQLEEENKQSQMLRVKQENIISNLKNQIANLKH